MRLVARATFASLFLTLPLAVAAQTPKPVFELVGENGATKTFTMSELAALPQHEITAEQDGGKLVFRGPTPRALVTMVGAPAGQALRGSASMMLAVVAEAGDGYKVAYALSELDPQF